MNLLAKVRLVKVFSRLYPKKERKKKSQRNGTQASLGTLPTETINIIASRSLEISLQALVSCGLPIGTNSKPGGGVFSVVICLW